MKRTFLEFFAGIGLVRLALEACGWRAIFANDIDPVKYEMYAANFSDAREHYHVCDIKELRSASIPPATLAQASFPCTDLSLAGYRQGLNGKQSGSYWAFVDLLAQFGSRRPPLVLIENVVGFVTSQNGQDFRLALRALSEIGYTYDALVLDAVHFVPQSRPRLFVVGIQQEISAGLSLIDAVPVRDRSLCPQVLENFILKNADLEWSFLPLPKPPSRKTDLADILERLDAGDSRWWSYERSQYLLNQMSPRHRHMAETMIQGDEISYGTVYRRIRRGKSMAELRIDGVAGCLRTPRGGSSRQILFTAGRGDPQGTSYDSARVRPSPGSARQLHHFAGAQQGTFRLWRRGVCSGDSMDFNPCD